MRLNKVQWIGIVAAFLLLVLNIIFFRGENLFYFLLGIAFLVVVIPFLVTFIVANNKEKEKNERFLEFSRNLAESVKTGTPIGKSIMGMRGKNYGALTQHIEKLANQISLGIPINRALETFAEDIGSDNVKRAVTLIREAEAAGGQIDNILDSVANSMYQIQKLKKERQAAISNLVVQGYIIFFIFIGIMLVMEFKILPLTADVGSIGSIGNFDAATATVAKSAAFSAEQLSRPFLYLLLVQGIFAGFTIGKLAEGSIRSGLKHSIILAAAAFLISSGAKAFL